MSSSAAETTIAPVFFGPDSSLYGCCHLAANHRQAPAVLICQPNGHEYERCHRAMRQLAVQSTRKGMSAMRFDYYATGDSAGDSAELKLAQMQLDLEHAIQYWRETTGVEHLAVVGIRLGATLAARLAGSAMLDALVLYAPVFDGQLLLADWRRDQQIFNDKHSHISRNPGNGEVLGFPVTDEFQSELAQKFLPALPASSLRRVLTLVDETELESEPLNEWLQLFRQQGVAVTAEAVEDIAIWRREPMEPIVPIKVIRRIASWLAEGYNA